MSHGGISTAVGALVRLLRMEGGRVGVLSYDHWRPKVSGNRMGSVRRENNLWRVTTQAAAREVVEFEPFEGLKRLVVHHPLLWQDAMALSRRLRVPVDFVVHVDALYVAQVTNRELPPHYEAIQPQIVAEASRVITPSRDVQRRWESNYPESSVYHAALPLMGENKVSEPATSAEILSIGRFDYVKGTDLLGTCIGTALRDRPEIRWTHVGGNPASPKTHRRWARKLQTAIGEDEHSRFSLFPWQQPDALETFYRRAQLVVISSRYETYGLVAREALAHGVGVVGFAVGGLNDIILDGLTGRLVKEVSAEALYTTVREALNELKENPSTWQKQCLEQAGKLEVEAVKRWKELMSI